MKGLSLWQPYAFLIARGDKTIETRSWSTKYRGPLAIHAAKQCHTGTIGDYTIEDDTPRRSPKQYLMRGPSLSWPYRLPLGAIVATCELVDVVPMYSMGEQSNLRRIELCESGALWLSEPDHEENGEEHTIEITGQRPYGDFAPGRYGWLLDNVQAVGPFQSPPGEFHRGLWEAKVTTNGD